MNTPIKSQDQPPAPGGDPDQPPNDLPQPNAESGASERGGKDKTGFGHMGNKDVPSSKDVPPPRQIF